MNSKRQMKEIKITTQHNWTGHIVTDTSIVPVTVDTDTWVSVRFEVKGLRGVARLIDVQEREI